MTSGNKTVNSKKKYNILQILGGVACALFCVAWLGGCVLFGASMCSFHEEKNPDSDEYVGVWAAYMVKVDDKKFYANSIDEVNDYLVLYENSSAQEVIFLASASEPKIIECSWQRTTENKKRRNRSRHSSFRKRAEFFESLSLLFKWRRREGISNRHSPYRRFFVHRLWVSKSIYGKDFQ